MSDIEWTDKTWNPIIGCTRVRRGRGVPSGCDNCYADDQVARFQKRYDRPTTIKLGATKRGTLTFVPRDPTTDKTLGHGAQWTGAVWLLPDVLSEPLKRKKPTMWFVNSLSDWAHESIMSSKQGRRFIAAMFGVMAACPQHTFQLLTKRPEQAKGWFEWLAEYSRARSLGGPADALVDIVDAMTVEGAAPMRLPGMPAPTWPLPNVWIGKSIEDQASADERLAIELPAVIDFVSAEPLIGPIDFRGRVPNWVIVGGESGPKARPCDIDWIRSVVRQCQAADVPVFCKQLGARSTILVSDAKGSIMEEWPEDLRIREMPEITRGS